MCVGCSPFAKLDLVSLFQFHELPPHERVIVRVDISCDERPSPVHLHAHAQCDRQYYRQSPGSLTLRPRDRRSSLASGGK